MVVWLLVTTLRLLNYTPSLPVNHVLETYPQVWLSKATIRPKQISTNQPESDSSRPVHVLAMPWPGCGLQPHERGNIQSSTFNTILLQHDSRMRQKKGRTTKGKRKKKSRMRTQIHHQRDVREKKGCLEGNGFRGGKKADDVGSSRLVSRSHRPL